MNYIDIDSLNKIDLPGFWRFHIAAVEKVDTGR